METVVAAETIQRTEMSRNGLRSPEEFDDTLNDGRPITFPNAVEITSSSQSRSLADNMKTPGKPRQRPSSDQGRGNDEHVFVETSSRSNGLGSIAYQNAKTPRLSSDSYGISPSVAKIDQVISGDSTTPQRAGDEYFSSPTQSPTRRSSMSLQQRLAMMNVDEYVRRPQSSLSGRRQTPSRLPPANHHHRSQSFGLSRPPSPPISEVTNATRSRLMHALNRINGSESPPLERPPRGLTSPKRDRQSSLTRTLEANLAEPDRRTYVEDYIDSLHPMHRSARSRSPIKPTSPSPKAGLVPHRVLEQLSVGINTDAEPSTMRLPYPMPQEINQTDVFASPDQAAQLLKTKAIHRQIDRNLVKYQQGETTSDDGLPKTVSSMAAGENDAERLHRVRLERKMAWTEIRLANQNVRKVQKKFEEMDAEQRQLRTTNNALRDKNQSNAKLNEQLDQVRAEAENSAALLRNSFKVHEQTVRDQADQLQRLNEQVQRMQQEKMENPPHEKTERRTERRARSLSTERPRRGYNDDAIQRLRDEIRDMNKRNDVRDTRDGLANLVTNFGTVLGRFDALLGRTSQQQPQVYMQPSYQPVYPEAAFTRGAGFEEFREREARHTSTANELRLAQMLNRLEARLQENYEAMDALTNQQGDRARPKSGKGRSTRIGGNLGLAQSQLHDAQESLARAIEHRDRIRRHMMAAVKLLDEEDVHRKTRIPGTFEPAADSGDGGNDIDGHDGRHHSLPRRSKKSKQPGRENISDSQISALLDAGRRQESFWNELIARLRKEERKQKGREKGKMASTKRVSPLNEVSGSSSEVSDESDDDAPNAQEAIRKAEAEMEKNRARRKAEKQATRSRQAGYHIAPVVNNYISSSTWSPFNEHSASEGLVGVDGQSLRSRLNPEGVSEFDRHPLASTLEGLIEDLQVDYDRRYGVYQEFAANHAALPPSRSLKRRNAVADMMNQALEQLETAGNHISALRGMLQQKLRNGEVNPGVPTKEEIEAWKDAHPPRKHRSV